MKYKKIKTGEPKPLADFYHGECFEAFNLEAMGITGDEESIRNLKAEDASLMMVVGIPECMYHDESPKNLVFCMDFDAGELCAYTDDNTAVPIQVEMVTDDIEGTEE